MARDVVGWEWGNARQLRAQHKREATERRRVALERGKAERALQQEVRRLQIEERITRAIEATWTLGGKGGATFYVYVLERLPVDPADKVKYVGVTDDPRRRYLEHRRCGRLGAADFRMVLVGEVRFPKAKLRRSFEHRPWSGLYFGNPINMRQVRQAEKTIAERYRAKGFELVNAD